MILSFHVRHLELALIKNLRNDLLTRHFTKLLQVILACHSSLLHISKNVVDLEYLVDVILGLVAPVSNLVAEAAKLKLLALSLQPHYGHISD